MAASRKIKDLNTLTKSVSVVLEPLIKEVATLQDAIMDPSKRRLLRNVHKLIWIVSTSVSNLIAAAEQIARENTLYQKDIAGLCREVHNANRELKDACHDYLTDTLEKSKRQLMEEKAKDLLQSVTSLLVLIDLIDIEQLVKTSSKIETKLMQLRQVKTWDKFVDSIKSVTKEIHSVSVLANARQKELSSTAAQKLLVAAHKELRQCNEMLITSTKIFLEQPDNNFAQENRDYVIGKMQEAIRIVSKLAEGTDPQVIMEEKNKEFEEEEEQEEEKLENNSLEQPSSPPPKKPPNLNLAKTIDTFETMLETSIAETPTPIVETPKKIQVRFDLIMSAAANLALSESTRDQHGLLAQCDVVREKLQSFLSVITTTNSAEEVSDSDRSNSDEVTSEGLEQASAAQTMTIVEEETATLRFELRKAMIDHVSDTFVDPFIPLNKMVESAQAGVVDDSSQQFITHADNLVHVASLVCSLTRDSDESRQVRMAAHELRSLKDQVLYAAKSLAGHPESQSAQKNMTAFKQAWINKVTHLTTSIDKVIPIQDFVAVTEAHIRDDSRHLMEKLESGDITMSVGCANVIKGRCGRLSQVILADISNNPTRYSHEQAYDIEQQLEHLENKILVDFQRKITSLAEKRNKSKLYESDMRSLEDHLQMINDSIRDIRKCILKTRTDDELKAEPDVEDIISPVSLTEANSFEFIHINVDQRINPPSPVLKKHGGQSPPLIDIMVEEVELSEEEYQMLLSNSSQATYQLEDIAEEEEEEEEEGGGGGEREREPVVESHKLGRDEPHHTSQRVLIKRTPSVAVINESETAQSMMAQLPASEQARIAQAQEKLNAEKEKFESEVNQWDDSSNDIVLLAKEMCWMMMDMSDFTRGIGPLKTTPDVVNTAKDIARAGVYLGKLVKQVLDQCPDDSCSKDLMAYMERIQLCCHQLKITSAVTADLNASVKDKVETANNLIITAKNLMNSVVQVVKSCYTASNAIERKKGSKPQHFMQWQLTIPKKKLLYSIEALNTSRDMYRENPKNSVSPIKALGDFKGRQKNQL